MQVNGVTEWVPGVANVGIRPMFRLQTPLLEVHLFDYDDDLYGKYLRVAFLNWIRPEQGFDIPSTKNDQKNRNGFYFF